MNISCNLTASKTLSESICTDHGKKDTMLFLSSEFF